MRKIILIVLVLLMLVPLLGAAGAKALDFTATDISGKKVKLFNYKDKVVVLDFWATWCPPCRKEIPHLIDIKKTFKDAPFEIISIALERGTDEAAIKFVGEHKMNWVHIIKKEVGRKLADMYKVQYLPTMYVIKNNEIVATGLRGEALKDKIKQLLR